MRSTLYTDATRGPFLNYKTNYFLHLLPGSTTKTGASPGVSWWYNIGYLYFAHHIPVITYNHPVIKDMT